MEKAYTDGNIALYVGDARNLYAIAGGEAQLVVTSPPYNVGVEYSGYHDKVPWSEYYALVHSALGEMYRILGPGGVLALVVPHHVNDRGPGRRVEPVYVRVWSLVEEAGFLIRQPIVWVKGWRKQGVIIAPNCAVGSPANPNFRAVHELILLASKDHFHRLGTGSRGGVRWQPQARLDWLKDVWVIPTEGARGGSNGKRHPAAFPHEIPSRLIQLFTEPGELVVDPFGGSMTTVEQARLLGRRAIGVDISEADVVKSVERLRQGVLVVAGY